MNKTAMTQQGDAKALHFLNVAQASRLIAMRALSPIELVEAFLARIDAVDGRIHSYITVLAERARAAAKKAHAEIAAGRWKGPLHGIPFAVKDNYHVAGVRTTGGSRLMPDYVADDTSTIVRRLEQAGAILLGKLNTWEYGTGNARVYRPSYGLRATPGISSALPRLLHGRRRFGCGRHGDVRAGSNTGGSIRLPAAHAACKASRRLRSRQPRRLHPSAGRSIIPVRCAGRLRMRDRAAGDRGYDERDPSSAQVVPPDYRQLLHQGVKGLVIGVVRDLGPEARRSIRPMHRDRRGGEYAQKPWCHHSRRQTAGAAHTLPSDLLDHQLVGIALDPRTGFHGAQPFDGTGTGEKMMSGFMVKAVDYLAALRLRKSLAKTTDALVRSCDSLLIANAFHVAPRFDEPDTVPLFTTETASSVFNITGHPALSICTGFDQGGMPLNAQIVGRYFDEATVLRVAQAYECATPWRNRRPNL